MKRALIAGGVVVVAVLIGLKVYSVKKPYTALDPRYEGVKVIKGKEFDNIPVLLLENDGSEE